MIDAAMILLLLKASVLLATALLAGYALRRTPATQRHRVWTTTFIALLALPPLAAVLPGLPLPVPRWSPPSTMPTVASAPAALSRLDRTVDRASPLEAQPTAFLDLPVRPLPALFGVSPGRILAGIWLGGVIGALVALIVALARVARLAATAEELDSSAWRDTCTRVAARLGYPRPIRVLASRDVSTPMAGGLRRPFIFVPIGAGAWDEERREIVAAHEIAHLASGDPIRKLLSRLTCTLYWFHPLVWLAQRQASSDCEQACDETVLSLGVRPSTYARVLLDFADAPPMAAAAAIVPIVRRQRLEIRLMAILRSSPRSARGRRMHATPMAAAVALTLAVAAAQPVAGAAAMPALDGSVAPASTIETARRPEQPSALATSGTAPRAVVQTTQRSQATACWSRGTDDRPFSGSISMSGTTIHEQIGRRGRERVIQTRFGDLRLCMVTEGFEGNREHRPSDWIGRSARVLLETAAPNDTRRMEIADGRIDWSIGGESRAVDDAAQEWRTALLAVLDLTWDLSQLRGEVSTLRGEISTIHGQRSTLQGEISTLHGHVSTLRGEISTLRGEESTLRGEISTIRGHESTLRGQISTERGAISTLEASRWDSRLSRDDIAARIRRHEDEIRRLEDEIVRYDADARVREMERRIAAFDVEGKVAAVEREIRQFDLDDRVRRVEREIDELDVQGRVAAIEREIDALDAPRRSRDLEDRRDAALTRLRGVLRR